MTVAVGNAPGTCATGLEPSQEECAVVSTFLDVCARTLDGYREALAYGQTDELRRIGDRLGSAARTLGIESRGSMSRPALRLPAEPNSAYQSLGELYAELQCLSLGLQALSGEG